MSAGQLDAHAGRDFEHSFASAILPHQATTRGRPREEEP